MATIEVDESELGSLKRIRDTVAKIATDPEAKKLLQKAHKKVDPQAVTPELDAEENKSQDFLNLKKEFDEYKDAQRAATEKRESDENLAALNRKFEAGRQKLRDRRYTPEGIEAVEKFMQERGIPDHEVAADHLEKQNPPQEVMSPRAFGSFNFAEPPKDDDHFVKALLDSKGNDDNAVLRAAVEAVSETRQMRR